MAKLDAITGIWHKPADDRFSMKFERGSKLLFDGFDRYKASKNDIVTGFLYDDINRNGKLDTSDPYVAKFKIRNFESYYSCDPKGGLLNGPKGSIGVIADTGRFYFTCGFDKVKPGDKVLGSGLIFNPEDFF